jgi:hypothetical protein
MKRKENIWQILKGEWIYLLLIVILSVFFLYLKTLETSFSLLLIVALLNLLVLETWLLKTFLLYSGRKISQYSEVIQRISFKDRFFDYFILPAIFLLTFMFYLYYNKNITLSYWITALCIFVLLILFINIKSSLKKIYKINTLTKGIFNLVCILTFYLSINVFLRFDLEIWVKLLIVGGLAIVMFLSELQLHDRVDIVSFIVSLLSAIFVSLSIGIFMFQSIFVATAIGTLAFYMIIALWNIRFAGKYKFIDYLPPFLYAIIALILIFNL